MLGKRFVYVCICLSLLILLESVGGGCVVGPAKGFEPLEDLTTQGSEKTTSQSEMNTKEKTRPNESSDEPINSENTDLDTSLQEKQNEANHQEPNQDSISEPLSDASVNEPSEKAEHDSPEHDSPERDTNNPLCTTQGGYCGLTPSQCQSGYTQSTNGSLGCPGGRSGFCCLPSRPVCGKEGDLIPLTGTCCQGLTRGTVATPPNCTSTGQRFVCVNCGNGTCESSKGENSCSCPSDCKPLATDCVRKGGVCIQQNTGCKSGYQLNTSISCGTVRSLQCCLPSTNKCPTCPSSSCSLSLSVGCSAVSYKCDPAVGICVKKTSSSGYLCSMNGTSCNQSSPVCMKSVCTHNKRTTALSCTMSGTSCIQSTPGCKNNRCSLSRTLSKRTCSMSGTSCIQSTPSCSNSRCASPKTTLKRTCSMSGTSCIQVNRTCNAGECQRAPQTNKVSCRLSGSNCIQSTPNCGSTGTCGASTKTYANYTCSAGKCVAPKDLPYPTRTTARLKGLQPDFWGNRQDVIGANTGGIAVNFVWATWEPSPKSPPCASNEQAFGGKCFKVPQHIENEIKAYSSKGVVVTGILYGVPAWARKGKICSPAGPGFEIFCSPNKASDYARFVGMIAHRYNGLRGHGRVADFVIHNEVNSNIWFDIGCGQGVPCDQKKWVAEYAANYIAAYDAVIAQQKHAKILISLDHHFGTAYDKPKDKNALISGMAIIKGVAAKAGSRKWRVAFHSYPPNLLAPEFSPNDFPKVTFGNLGVLAGWLRQQFPNTPSAWQIQLTENGVNSLKPSTQTKQKEGLCNAFRNIVGTPGIESFIYHRMKDHPAETATGLGVGLRDTKGVAKLAWNLWTQVNRTDLNPPRLSCGFEFLPYIQLNRSFHTTHGHWASSRIPPAGFKVERSWRILRDPKPNTQLLYECKVGNHNFLTTVLSCENQFMLGPVGYVYKSKQANTIPLYRCRVGAGQDHFISNDPKCEKQTTERLLGYVYPK